MRRLSPPRILAYSAGSLAAGLYYAFNSFVLSLYLSAFTNNAILIIWLSSARSFEQTLIQPVVGTWSDRTWTRLGRRAPFFLTGMFLSAGLLIVNGFLPHKTDLLPIVAVTIFAFSLMFNVGIDPYNALLADVTPSEQRGTVSGIATLFQFLGQVGLLVGAALLFGAHPDWVFTAVGLALIVGFGIVALGVREPRERTGELHETRSLLPLFIKAPRRALTLFGSYLRQLWRAQREAVKLLGVRFLYQFGINAAVPIITLFVSTEIGLRGWPEILAVLPPALGSNLKDLDPPGVALLMGAVLLVLQLVYALPIGVLGDRFGKKPVFMVGLVVLAVSAFLSAFATSLPQLLLYLVFLAFGNAIQTVLFFPYLTDLVPADRVGEFAGLSAAAETGGVALSAVVAGELINLNLFDLRYRLVFVLTALFVMIAAVALAFVRQHRPGVGIAGASG